MKKEKIVLLIAMCGSSMIVKAQALETEESKPLLPGQVEMGTGLEFQTSKEGTENALPLAFEFGLSKKFTLLVEPVAFTNISPKVGPHVTGIGDLEITLFYQFMSEEKAPFSLSLSGEVKLPTAKNRLIGTGKTDYTPFLILTKTTGKFFTSINLSYTFLGKPPGVQATDLFNYAIGTIYNATPKWILFAEVYGNTSATGGIETPEGSAVVNPNVNTAELAGGETVGAAGFGYYPKTELMLSFGVSYDNNKAVLFRPGIEWKFGGKPQK
jgi:hypothetical protein